MKISLNWLNDYVDLSDVTPVRVAELLSLHTAEVEGIEVFGESIQDVVVGHVLECGQHPAADKLSVTLVDYGGEEPVPVVCGASNVRQGLKIAFAPIGSKLPGDFKIKKAKLRGVESRGMICSERELELSENHEGIMELQDDAHIGEPLVQHLGILDHILELDNKSLTHRPDLWGHYGFARELAAILHKDLKPLELADLPIQEAESGSKGSSCLGIQIDDPESCGYYSGLQVALDGPPKPSPEWMQRRLQAVDQRPLDDLVDLTNYILLEIGQPTHAFDLDKIAGQQIVVRRATEGESIKTLDEQDHKLRSSDLVIADPDGPVALAGVMGGHATEVGSGTHRILLESASFHPTRIRRTAHRLALRTEASARFEKSLDPAYALQAIMRFAFLLQKIRPNAKMVTPVFYSGRDQSEKIQLELDPARTAELLGLDLSKTEVIGALNRLGFTVQEKTDGLTVEVPSWRSTKDVTTEIDLVEEVGRLSGYDKIQAVPLRAPVIAPRPDPMRNLIAKLAGRLAGAHQAYETQGYTFLHEEWASRLQAPLSSFVLVDNPVQEGIRLIRPDLIPSLLEQTAGNMREHPTGSLFEIGKGYIPSPDGGLPLEKRWVGVVLWQPELEAEHGPASLFGRAKMVCEDLLRTAGLLKFHIGSIAGEESIPAWAHPIRSLTYPGGLGLVADVHPTLSQKLGLNKGHVAAILLDLEALLQASLKVKNSFEPPSRFPAIKVDVALAVPKELAFSEIHGALQKAGGKVLHSIELFDLFEGGNLPEGQRSLAFHAVLRSPDRTLTDKDEQKFLKKVIQTTERLGGSLRS
jgi:phenylalanyl-tRNA synthetase beta chain